MGGRRTTGKSNQQAQRTGLGNALANDHRKRMEAFLDAKEKVTGVSEKNASRSVLEQNSLDDFLAQASLANAMFPAERIRRRDEVQEGPRLIAVRGDGAEAASNEAQRAAAKLVVPIPWRPLWMGGQSAEDLAAQEGEAFLDWRRSLAALEEQEHVVMTPYEKNLDFWRQLWRCVERSDLLVQIVDARDPYFYRSRDLERYVATRFPGKKHLLLMNKSDFLSPELRKRWAARYAKAGVEVLFFSALRELHRQHRVPGASSRWDPLAGTRQDRDEEGEGQDATEEGQTQEQKEEGEGEGQESQADATAKEQTEQEEQPKEAAKEPEQPDSTIGASAEVVLPPHGAFDADASDVLDCAQLLEELKSRLPGNSSDSSSSRGVVGFVGYPNVGKSSVINALFGAKKVSMSRTPGKTKHLQTLALEGTDITLCDCPGLVFPSVVATRGHLAINGTVPLVELRDAVQPMRLIVEKLGAAKVAQKYELPQDLLEEAEKRIGTEVDDTRRLLAAYAVERKHFLKLGVPDETWSARKMLHDYCTGALLHCEEPPEWEEEAPTLPPAGSSEQQHPQAAQYAPPTRGSAKAKAGSKERRKGSESDFSDLEEFLYQAASGAAPLKGKKGNKKR